MENRGLNKNRLIAPIFKSLGLLSENDRKKIYVFVLGQIFLSLFDLVAILLTGVLGSIVVYNVQSRNLQGSIQSLINFIGLEERTFTEIFFILSIAITVLLSIKTLASILFTRKMLHFMGARGVSISNELVKKFMHQSLEKANSKTSQEIMYSLTTSVDFIVGNMLPTFFFLMADLFLLSILSITLLIFDFYVALVTIFYFSFVGYLVYSLMQKKARILGYGFSSLITESNNQVNSLVASFREILVSNKQLFFSQKIMGIRGPLAHTKAEINFQPYLTKYIIEASIILGGIVIAFLQFIFYDAATAASSAAIFIASATRVVPALMRVQQGLIQIRSGEGVIEPTFELIENLSDVEVEDYKSPIFTVDHNNFKAEIEISNLFFSYKTNPYFALNDINIKIQPGMKVAVVGPSGSGKSTFFDLLLGVIKPKNGHVLISGLNPREAFKRFPGAIAYVPQNVFLADSSIRSNIALGWNSSDIEDHYIVEAAQQAAIYQFVQNLPNAFEAKTGELGSKISGGQRQRIGIARALLTKPKLIIMDEATSALDAETEQHVNRSIDSLGVDVTVIVSAHRLSTIIDADLVLYMESGKIIAAGKFEEVRAQVPNFDTQANIMGI
jgi:ABC-type multidrug transport system fused ATPase/permease subunit